MDSDKKILAAFSNLRTKFDLVVDRQKIREKPSLFRDEFISIEFNEFIEDLPESRYVDNEIETWITDINFTISQLERQRNSVNNLLIKYHKKLIVALNDKKEDLVKNKNSKEAPYKKLRPLDELNKPEVERVEAALFFKLLKDAEFFRKDISNKQIAAGTSTAIKTFFELRFEPSFSI